MRNESGLRLFKRYRPWIIQAPAVYGDEKESRNKHKVIEQNGEKKNIVDIKGEWTNSSLILWSNNQAWGDVKIYKKNTSLWSRRQCQPKE